MFKITIKKILLFHLIFASSWVYGQGLSLDIKLESNNYDKISIIYKSVTGSIYTTNKLDLVARKSNFLRFQLDSLTRLQDLINFSIEFDLIEVSNYIRIDEIKISDSSDTILLNNELLKKCFNPNYFISFNNNPNNFSFFTQRHWSGKGRLIMTNTLENLLNSRLLNYEVTLEYSNESPFYYGFYYSTGNNNYAIQGFRNTDDSPQVFNLYTSDTVGNLNIFFGDNPNVITFKEVSILLNSDTLIRSNGKEIPIKFGFNEYFIPIEDTENTKYLIQNYIGNPEPYMRYDFQEPISGNNEFSIELKFDSLLQDDKFQIEVYSKTEKEPVFFKRLINLTEMDNKRIEFEFRSDVEEISDVVVYMENIKNSYSLESVEFYFNGRAREFRNNDLTDFFIYPYFDKQLTNDILWLLPQQDRFGNSGIVFHGPLITKFEEIESKIYKGISIFIVAILLYFINLKIFKEDFLKLG